MSEGFWVQSRFKDYEVCFCDDFAKEFATHRDRSFFLIDSRIFSLYGERITKEIPPEKRIVIDALETNKTMEFCLSLIPQLVEKQVKRGMVLVAIGGGIIQDITCFTASILYRGIDWIFYPTTLLAQADSCIGSKSSINLGKFKNLVGTFYPPRQILLDPSFTKTLSVDDVKSGVGEILHYYLIDNSPMIPDLVSRYDDFLKNPLLLKDHIHASLAIKKPMVEKDEWDQGERNVFNYGHTFGHAIESVSGYAVSHGQAVTLGMDIANFISWKQGLITKEVFDSLHGILKKNIPSYVISSQLMPDYLAALSKDKKNTNDDLTCILTQGLGRMKKMQIPLDEILHQNLTDYFSL